MKTFAIYTLGCKVNSYESEAIKGQLIKKGYELVSLNDASYIIINTCCVTNTAASKSRQKIHSIHKTNPNAKLIVMGCYVQGFTDEIEEIEGISLIIGTSNRGKIAELIDTLDNQINLVKNIKEFNKYEELEITSCFENTRAYLKIQDGCNNYCSYCIIPYVRGVIKSRDKESVLNEARNLLALGYKEIVLTGISTGSYGKDLDGYSFSNLVSDLLDLDGLYRLRISSIEESEIDDKLIDMLTNRDNLAKHLHIPLQAGSDHVLKMMNRRYNLDTFVNRMKSIKEKLPEVALTTDVIVGFPGETEEDFQSTLNTCNEIGFAKIHVFPFSSRKGTVASKLPGHLNGDVKKERATRLIALSDKLGLEYNSRYVNQVVDVLVEEKVDEYYVGHTTNFIKVKFFANKKLDRNVIKKVKVISAYDSYVMAVEE